MTGVGRAAAALAGTLLAVALASLGLLISLWSRSNRGSLSLALFLLLALLAPTQLPAGATRGWAGDLLLHVNPLTAGSEYLYRVVVRGTGSQDLGWLASPVLGAAVLAGLAVIAARGLRLQAGLAR